LLHEAKKTIPKNTMETNSTSLILLDILKTSRQALSALNVMKSSVAKCKTANRTNKLPGTKYSTSESLTVGYTYIKHCNYHGSRKGTESMKVTQIP